MYRFYSRPSGGYLKTKPFPTLADAQTALANLKSRYGAEAYSQIEIHDSEGVPQELEAPKTNQTNMNNGGRDGTV